MSDHNVTYSTPRRRSADTDPVTPIPFNDPWETETRLERRPRTAQEPWETGSQEDPFEDDISPSTEGRPRHAAGKNVCAAVIIVSLLLIIGGLAWVFYPKFQEANRPADWEAVQLAQSASNADHGEFVTEVMNSLRNEKSEFIVAFNDRGDKLCDFGSNDGREVTLPSTLRRGLQECNNVVLMHNHAEVDGSTFSLPDLQNLAMLRPGIAVVVGKNYNYYLQPKQGNNWPEAGQFATWAEQVQADGVYQQFFEVTETHLNEEGSEVYTLASKRELLVNFAETFGFNYLEVDAETDRTLSFLPNFEPEKK